MSDFSNYVENIICGWVRGTTMPAAPSAVYVGLFSSSPGETGSAGTEVTTTIRTAGRLAVTFGAPNDGVIANTAAVDFGNAQSGASVTHFGVFDAASAGNLLFYRALNSGSGAITAGQGVKFEAGALTLTVQ